MHASEALLAALFEAPMLFAGVFELQGDDYRYVLANANTASAYGKRWRMALGAGVRSGDLRRRRRHPDHWDGA